MTQVHKLSQALVLRPDAPETDTALPDWMPQTPISGDVRALDRLGWPFVAQARLLPLQATGAVTPIACDSLETFARHEAHLSRVLGPVVFQLSPPDIVNRALLDLRGQDMAMRAETVTPASESCRNWSGQRTACIAALALVALACVTYFAPTAILIAITAWAALTLLATTGLRLIGALAQVRHARTATRGFQSAGPHSIDVGKLPRISLLVPLYDEQEIAGKLIKRLEALEYPRDRLDICLILEDRDLTTANALSRVDLPDWMQIVPVPHGSIRTKPRAMNYALDFTDGDIVGVYDAEDAPAPDQLMKVAAGFARAGSDVACLQGVLDFYNAGATWLTRCFAIDYAAWFRLVLPGLVRLGVVIPLGGTTVFFRRTALEDLGRWDAHNVTEDADLGVRLARHGYRADFFDSVTDEEATSTVRAWIKQRSRWIKGYAVTWAVHMRRPRNLLRSLGLWRFLCVQILFLGTLSQVILAPVLWSFWGILFGLAHPLSAALPWEAIVSLAALFFFCEVATLLILALAVATPRRRWLIKWVPLMHLYFPLAAFAAWKGLGELITRPFYWDKTAHGIAPQNTTRRWANRLWRPRRRPA